MNLDTLNCPSCGAPINIQPKPYETFTCPACHTALMLTDFTDKGFLVCERCRKVNSPTDRYCIECNAALQAGCPYCYELNPIEAPRCQRCGVDLQRAWGQQRNWLNAKTSYDSERREATRQAILNGRKQEIERLLVQLDEPQNHPLAIFCLQQYGEEAVDGLMQALSSPDPDARYGAAHTLGLIGARQAIPALINALSDAEPAVRFWAANSLGSLKAAEAVQALFRLRKDKTRSVRDKALEALKSIGTTEALSALKKW